MPELVNKEELAIIKQLKDFEFLERAKVMSLVESYSLRKTNLPHF